MFLFNNYEYYNFSKYFQYLLKMCSFTKFMRIIEI